MSTGLGLHLGHYVAPGAPPHFTLHHRPISKGLPVDPHTAVDRALIGSLGPGLDRIERIVQFQGAPSQGSLAEHVINQPVVRQVLSNNDTFTLLGTASPNAVFRPQLLTINGQTEQFVVLTLPAKDLFSIQQGTVFVQVDAGDPAPGPPGTVFQFGFLFDVPLSSLSASPDGSTITVVAPASVIPTTVTNQNGSLASIQANFQTIGPLLTTLFQSGVPAASPSAVPGVPGLRLVDFLKNAPVFAGVPVHRYLQMMRVAVAQHLFESSIAQNASISQGLNQFLMVVTNFSAQSTEQLNQLLASKPAGALIPQLPTGRLNGTLAVSLGEVQPVINGMPERIDIGYVFARNGDFGLYFSARSPLTNTLPPTSPDPTKVVAGDVQTEVSDASSLAQLNGWRVVEGVTEGSVREGALALTNQNGVATFAASTGYGGGEEFGLGMRYTQVLPLGNVFSGLFIN